MNLYNFRPDDFFHDGERPLVTTVAGCDQINKWIRRGEHFPIIKLRHFFSLDGIELRVFQKTETLEVMEVYGDNNFLNMEDWSLILKGTVPRINLDPIIQAYMVPQEAEIGEEVLIPKIIKDKRGISYLNHHGGIRAKFIGDDLIFLERPNQLKVYRH